MMGLKQFRKMIQNMRYWCFNCEKITLPKPGLKCQFCESDALEEIRDQNNPAQYVPYNVPAQTQPQQMPQPQLQQQIQQEPPVVRVNFFQTTFTMPFLPIPPISIFGLFGLAGNESNQTPVDAQKYNNLERTAQLSSECAVCQERAGSGVKLGCAHEFHEDCIKPWFRSANTCPCCRATV